MKISQEKMDKIFKEMMAEYKKLSEKTKDEKATFHNLEGAALTLGQEFERRVLKAALEEEQKKLANVKKMSQLPGKNPKSWIEIKNKHFVSSVGEVFEKFKKCFMLPLRRMDYIRQHNKY